MKKTYQNPKMTIVKVHTNKMIAASPDGFAGSLGDSSHGGNGNRALGRRGSSWDDEEEY